jgi:hypothetical protein
MKDSNLQVGKYIFVTSVIGAQELIIKMSL